MFNPLQSFIDWFMLRWDELMAAINLVTVINSLAAYVASLLPEPDPRLADVVNQAVAVVDTFVRFVGLADYVINLPVYLLVIGIIIVAETAFNIIRAWRLVRSFIT